MSERRSNWLAPLLVVAAIILAFVLAYVAAYFSTGQAVYSSPGGPVAFRVFQSKWLATLFTPAAKVESGISGNQVSVAWTEGGITVMPNP